MGSEDGTEYVTSLIEDINKYLADSSRSFSGVFKKEVVDYIKNFYYNFKLVFNLNPVELSEFSKIGFKTKGIRNSRLIYSTKLNEAVFHEARPQELKGGLIDDVLEEWAEPTINRYIRKIAYKRKHLLRKYPFRVGTLNMGKVVKKKKLKYKICSILSKFIQKQEFLNISHEAIRYKRVAIELNNLIKIDIADNMIKILLHNFMDPTDMGHIKGTNEELSILESDYLRRKLFHFWSYKHYMRCRALAIKYMKYLIYYDRIVLGDYGR